LSLLGFLLLSAACGPIVEQAPFTARPDALATGDLLGPFDGVVVDAETDRPVAGATVAASWAFERGVGLQGPAGSHEVIVETGADGRYRIPALRELPGGGSMRVRRFTLVVYHRGHVGWRSDRRFPNQEPRRDFAQRGNRVRLDRWQEPYLHHRHLAFLGGGAAIRDAAAWELQAASFELDGGGRPAPRPAAAVAAAAPRPLDVTALLSEDEVRGVTGYAGELEVGKLPDLPTTEFYDSRHFKAKGRPETYDVGLRVWRLGSAAAEAQYAKLLAELPGAQSRDEIGDLSFRARTPDVLGLAFLARDRGIVVSVSCGAAQCTDPAMLLRIGKLVEGHLADLPAPSDAQPATPPPTAAPPAPAGAPPAQEESR
jgi:hypothetical protein